MLRQAVRRALEDAGSTSWVKRATATRPSTFRDRDADPDARRRAHGRVHAGARRQIEAGSSHQHQRFGVTHSRAHDARTRTPWRACATPCRGRRSFTKDLRARKLVDSVRAVSFRARCCSPRDIAQRSSPSSSEVPIGRGRVADNTGPLRCVKEAPCPWPTDAPPPRSDASSSSASRR